MESIRLKKVYISKGHEFEITTSLKEKSLTITYIIKYSELSGHVNSMQIDYQYVNQDELINRHYKTRELCDSIAERLSGWKEVTRTLEQLGFDIIDNE
jgi:hypothetical protein